MTKKYIGFNPIKQGDGNYFWSVGNSYGTMQFTGTKQTLFVMGDALSLSSFGLKDGKKIVSITVDGESIPFIQNKNILSFAEISVHSILTIRTESE